MTEHWPHELTAEGWVIRDESGKIVAVVPDARHVREADAIRIARALKLVADQTARQAAEP